MRPLPTVVLWACLLLAPPPSLATEDLLGGQLANLQKSRAGVSELYVLAAGLSSRQDVFRNDVESMRDLLDRHWNSANRSVALVASEQSKSLYAYPTRANLTQAAEGIHSKINPGKDVLLVFLSSHGTSEGLARRFRASGNTIFPRSTFASCWKHPARNTGSSSFRHATQRC